MAHQLSFERLIRYDAGESGITLEATLKLLDRSVSLAAKVDTGATYCIFERRYGESLGLNIESGLEQPIGTTTGRFLTHGHEVTLVVGGFTFDSIVYFADDEGLRRNVLGRYGWLDRVVLGIVDYEGRLLLSPYSGT
ncbi:MAG: aspartyl protease family protein [Blastocatellia bacterium]